MLQPSYDLTAVQQQHLLKVIDVIGSFVGSVDRKPVKE